MNTESNADESSIQNLAYEAHALIAATADVAEESVVQARNRLASALDNARGACARIQQQAIQQARAADKVVRAHPYQAIGVALSLGAVAGFLCRRWR